MPLNAASPTWHHVLQNLCLIVLAALLAPFCTAIGVVSWIASPYSDHTKQIRVSEQWRKLTSKQRRVLVTGVGMSKGLSIARAFHRAGHQVIAADFEPYRIPVCGRFSKAVETFYRLPQVSSADSISSNYINTLVAIIQKEKIELWISCSGVASAVEDAEAAEAVQKATKCKVIQLNVEMTKTLHEKYSFIENTQRLGLNVPETHLICSTEDAISILHAESCRETNRRYIMKSVGLDDSIRADMTQLPMSSTQKTMAHVSKLRPSSSRQFVLQQLIHGPEYCTHCLVIRGRVMAFTACASADMLMHYKGLPSTSPLFQAMLDYTRIYARKMGTEMTGHFSMDFLLDGDETEKDIMRRIFPIECNPRAHTAVVLFTDDYNAMTDAYLDVLDADENVRKTVKAVFPSSNVGYYWIGHDIVTRLVIPLVSMFTLRLSPKMAVSSLSEFMDHVLNWKDGTFEVWDPWPFWWLYCVYWPGMFLVSIATRSWWSRCNVSTTKLFRC